MSSVKPAKKKKGRGGAGREASSGKHFGTSDAAPRALNPLSEKIHKRSLRNKEKISFKAGAAMAADTKMQQQQQQQQQQRNKKKVGTPGKGGSPGKQGKATSRQGSGKARNGPANGAGSPPGSVGKKRGAQQQDGHPKQKRPKQQRQQRKAGGNKDGGGGKKSTRPGATFAASRQLAAAAPHLEPQQQADWLWTSYSEHTGASPLERGPLTGDSIATLPNCPPEQAAASGGVLGLEERIKALDPLWQQHFCSTAAFAGGAGGSRGQGSGARQAGEGGGGTGGMAPEGSPVLLVVGPSAVSANNAIKALPEFNKAVRVAKLFAKHFKVEEQQQMLQRSCPAVGSGTPARLAKLAEMGCLKLDRLKWVLLDVHLDMKQRTILDIPETRADFWSLYDLHLKPLLQSGQTKLCLFSGAESRAGLEEGRAASAAAGGAGGGAHGSSGEDG